MIIVTKFDMKQKVEIKIFKTFKLTGVIVGYTVQEEIDDQQNIKKSLTYKILTTQGILQIAEPFLIASNLTSITK